LLLSYDKESKTSEPEVSTNRDKSMRFHETAFSEQQHGFLTHFCR